MEKNTQAAGNDESVRKIAVTDDKGMLLDVDVEVEPRDAHTKSHAGIFIRSDGHNVRPGRTILGSSMAENVSADIVLQDVRWELLELSELQTCIINRSHNSPAISDFARHPAG